MLPAAATTLRGALFVLAHGDNAWLAQVERQLGRVLSAPSSRTSMLGLYGWFDDMVLRLVREAISRTTAQLPSLRGLERREAITALHTVLVADTFFETVRKSLTITRALRMPGRSDWHQEDHSFVSNLYSDDLPAPNVIRGFPDQVAAIGAWAADRGGRVHNALQRTNPPEVSRTLLKAGFADDVIRRYVEAYAECAADIPEFALWTGPAQPSLDEFLALAATASPPPAGDLLDTLSRINQAALDAGDDVHVTPNYRATTAGPSTRVTDEAWWAAETEPRQDVELLIVSHLTDADATRSPLLVVGGPGSGKTTLAKVLAARLPHNEFTVLRVSLRKAHGDAPVVEHLDQALWELVDDQLSWPDLADQNRGRLCVVILDGLDEMPSAGPRHLAEVARFQQLQASLGHPVAVVVTSRTSFLDGLLIPDGTAVVRLEEFDEAQIGAWVEAWNRANPRLGPMTPEAALAHPELARIPALLSMLAQQVTDPATPRPTSALSLADLYQRYWIERVESSQVSAVAALGMFNRGRQSLSEAELTADLTALGHQLDDSIGTVLRNYETWPASFVEYQVAASVLDVLANGVDDELLFALLSHRPLALRPSTMTFVTEIAAELESARREELVSVLTVLIERYHEPRDTGRYSAYQPTPPHAVSSLAAYSANLVLLLLFVQPTAKAGSRELVDLWALGLDADGHRAVLSLIMFDGAGFVRRPVREPGAPREEQLGVEIVHQALSAGTRAIGQVTWSSDGTLLTANSGDVVTCWRIAEDSPPEVVREIPEVSDLAWHPLRPIAAVVQRSTRSGRNRYSHRLQVISFEAGTTRVISVVNKGTRISWSPDSESLALSDSEGVWIHDITTGEQREVLVHDPSAAGPSHYLLKPRWSKNADYVWAATSNAVHVIDTTDLTSPYRHRFTAQPLDVFVSDGIEGVVASSSPDGTDIEIDVAGTHLSPAVLEGHTKPVTCGRFSPNGDFFASMSLDNTVRIWRCQDWQCVAVLPRENISRRGGLAFHPTQPLLAVKDGSHVDVFRLDYGKLGTTGAAGSARKYANAKIVLVGDTRVGKSGLGLVLSGQPFVPTDSTHGRNVWTFEKSYTTTPAGEVQTREALLWDLAGQPGYRMVHQLHLNEVAVALVVFDARSETDPFAGVQYWGRALAQARRLDGAAAVDLKVYLVAARTDRGGTAVSTGRIDQAVRAFGFDGFVETSAKEGWGVDELVRTVRDAIDWDALPVVTSTALFQSIKDFLLEEKQQGRMLSTVDDLLHGFRRVRGDETPAEELADGFAACLGRLESVGVVRRMTFGDHVLLRPELLDAYASSLVQAARDEPDGLGFVPEEDALEGRFRMPESERLTNPQQERILLNTVVQELLRREIALKEHTDREVDLIFPSQFTRERPDAPRVPGQDVVFTFDGDLQSIYSTLAVRLSHSRLFQRGPMYHNSASYLADAGGTCGIAIREIEEGKGELVLFYDDQASPIVRRQFEAYVVEHLEQRAVAGTVTTRRVRTCRACRYTIPDELVQGRLGRGATTIRCPMCEESVVSLVDQPVAGDVRPVVAEMNSNANAQRDQDVAATTLKGKREAEDYDVFLCHNVKDKQQVLEIARRLEAHGILPWLDVDAIQPGSRWQDAMAKGIEKSRSAAVLIGPAGFGPWHDAEMHLINDWSVRDARRRVIPVILNGTDEELELPGFLRVWSTIDMRMADPDPFEQLIWGITGEQPRWA
jgi:GTPase SAR1 family protein